MFLKKLIDLILYSNLWIGLCATAMCMQSQYIFSGELEWSWLAGLILFSTLFLYAIHRIVGFEKVKNFQEIERYAVISNYKNHIKIYAFLAGIGAVISFFKLNDLSLQLSLVVPSIVSLGYAIPFLENKKRLRDINHIKIFLIAIVWAWVTVILPAIELNKLWETPTWLMSAERALFIFAICLPFDIRDLEVDAKGGVKTIPAVFGLKKTRWIGLGTLVLAFVCSLFLWQMGNYNLNSLLGISISFLIAYFLLHISNKMEHDYFFTGVVDGLMLVQFGVIMILEFV